MLLRLAVIFLIDKALVLLGERLKGRLVVVVVL
jgi:hypothetical protein